MLASLLQHWMMRPWLALCAIAVSLGVAVIASRAQPSTPNGPTYTADGRLDFPKTYRTWVYLSSGMDMSYLENPRPGLSTFGNVFAKPEAYDAFVKTGTWPDKTMLVLEVREAQQNRSINRKGQFQGDVLHTEVHLKDVARFAGGWAFFRYADESPATMISQTANCYSCHQANGAVDTTFVQFYPTLLPIARAMNTLTPGYAAEETTATPRN